MCQVLATFASELFLFWAALSEDLLAFAEVVSFREFLDTSLNSATGVFGYLGSTRHQ